MTPPKKWKKMQIIWQRNLTEEKSAQNRHIYILQLNGESTVSLLLDGEKQSSTAATSCLWIISVWWHCCPLVRVWSGLNGLEQSLKLLMASNIRIITILIDRCRFVLQVICYYYWLLIATEYTLCRTHITTAYNSFIWKYYANDVHEW